MRENVKIQQLEAQVVECYSYFMNNHQNSNFDNLEMMLLQLKKSMSLLTITNIINLIDRIIEDGSTKEGRGYTQFNVSSIQTTKDNKIYLVCHEILGVDAIDKKYILDDVSSYIDFIDVKKIY